jgi:hypothetical protein
MRNLNGDNHHDGVTTFVIGKAKDNNNSNNKLSLTSC